MQLHQNSLLRKLFLPLFSLFNPGDIMIRHHFTSTPFKLHSFKHKGYWFYGKKREQETMECFSKIIKPGDTIIEIGGHIGYISVYFSYLTGKEGRVYVFEPGSNNLTYLTQNAASLDNIKIIPKGVGDKDGEMVFFIENLTGQNNSFVKDYHILLENSKNAHCKTSIKTEPVTVVSIDTFLKENAINPKFIKIDVEGFELQVLAGMHKTLSTIRPMMMIEITKQSEEIFKLLSNYGYTCYTTSLQRITDPAQMNLNIFCFHKQTHTSEMNNLNSI